MKNTKRFMAAVMAAAMVSALAPMAVFAESKNTEVTLIKAPTTDDLYIVTIPSNLTVENSGWNALSTGIKVEKAPKAGTTDEFLQFEPTKKVAVTASSENSWKLVANGVTQNVGYTLKSTSADTSAVTNWDFMADEITPAGTTKTAGIDVDATDYAAAPAGTYTDKITFTISVEDAVTPYTPQTYTSLTVGTVLHVGDALDLTEDLNLEHGFLNSNYIWTLVRGNISSYGEEPFAEVTFTESDNGDYYVFKGVYRTDPTTVYMEYDAIPVTATSDGITVTALNGANVRFAVHES